MKTYKLQIEEKDREINKLKEKEMFLNKRVKILDSKKNINISNSNEIRSDSMSIINSTRREFSNFTIKNHKKCPINIIKRNNKSNYSNNQASFNNSSIKNKKMINSTIGLSTVNLNKSEINTSLVKKNNKPNTNESINYHLNKSLLCRQLGIRLIHIYEFESYQTQLQLLKDLILGIDNYPKNDFNKNNLIKKIPNPEIIYNDGSNIIYGAGKLY